MHCSRMKECLVVSPRQLILMGCTARNICLFNLGGMMIYKEHYSRISGTPNFLTKAMVAWNCTRMNSHFPFFFLSQSSLSSLSFFSSTTIYLILMTDCHTFFPSPTVYVCILIWILCVHSSSSMLAYKNECWS